MSPDTRSSPKRRKPTDATLRNVRAGHARDSKLTKNIEALRRLVVSHARSLEQLSARVERIESRKDALFAHEQTRLGYRSSFQKP